MAEPVRDGRAGQALASQRLDRVGDLVTEAVWAAMSARGPIDKAGGALGAVTIPPFADGFAGDADRGGEGCRPFTTTLPTAISRSAAAPPPYTPVTTNPPWSDGS